MSLSLVRFRLATFSMLVLSGLIASQGIAKDAEGKDKKSTPLVKLQAAKEAADEKAEDAAEKAAEEAANKKKAAEEAVPLLTIGSKAPSIDIEHWVSNGNGKFEPITDFEDGKVYVVEFWATWCGPCIYSMPHLAETQIKYADQNVQLISVSNEDLGTVEGFLKREVRGTAKKAESTGGDDEADGEKDSEEDSEEETDNTYAGLTSVYCLTTDPDRSVSRDYMTAAKQNGIPTCFLVGKTGLIEWIGHPMQMDSPLDQIVNDKWDRDEYLVKFRAQQELSAMTMSISKLIREGKSDEANEAIAKAEELAGDDDRSLSVLARLKTSVIITPFMTLYQSGEREEALAMIEELMEDQTPEMQSLLMSSKYRAQMSGRNPDYEGADQTLREMSEMDTIDPSVINGLAWSVYQLALRIKNLPAETLEGAVFAMEKAIEKTPKSGFMLSTLSHLEAHRGNLDRAIEIQTQAVSYPESSNEEMTEYLNELKKLKADAEQEPAEDAPTAE